MKFCRVVGHIKKRVETNFHEKKINIFFYIIFFAKKRKKIIKKNILIILA